MSYKDSAAGSKCQNLHEAARNGDLQQLQRLVQKGLPLDEGDTRGWRPLHEAAYENHVDCLDYLLKQEATDVNWRSFDGVTALNLACTHGHVESVARLLDAGADHSLADHMSTYPIHNATIRDSHGCVRMLVTHGAEVNVQKYTGSTPLHLASTAGYPTVTEYLLHHGGDPRRTEDYGLSPLFCAAQHGHEDCVRVILEHARDTGDRTLVDLCADDHATPLYLAAQEGHTDTVRLLLGHGASVNICTQNPVSLPLHAAVQFNHTTIVKLLLPHTDLSTLAQCDMSAYYFSVSSQDTQCTAILANSGVISPSQRHRVQEDSAFRPCNLRYFSLTVVYSRRQAPLVELAMASGSCDQATVLLDAGATVNARTPYEVPPLLAALEYKRYKLAELLIRRGASMNIYHPKVISNMTLVVSYCRWEMLNLVLRCGAEVWSLFTNDVLAPPPASSRLAELEDALSDHGDDQDYENEVGVLRYPVPFWRLLAEARMSGHRTTVAQMLHRILMFVGTVKLDHRFQSYVDSKEEWRSLCSITESPRLLTHLCRVKIRERLGSVRLVDPQYIRSLPLPDPVTDYLLYSNLTAS